ncbi:MAG: alginate export family protein [Thermoanaerobaculia bacterium]|nr:alginate export family protein [Thermoanaerobaculia bacterium]
MNIPSIRRSICIVWPLAFLILVGANPSLGQEESGEAGEEAGFELYLSGFYAFNGYTQNNFFLGRDAVSVVSDGDDYAIQMLRLQPEVRYGENLRVVARLDMAQGIWGVDNENRSRLEPGFSDLFDNKETNFFLHVDWAFVEATVPKLGDTTFRLGRMKNSLGNLLVLDQDGDGIQIQKSFGEWGVTFDWTKMFEGVDGLTDEDFGSLDGEDADLFYLELSGPAGGFTLNPYVAHYRDQGDDDGRTYIPQELDYFKPRFAPNVSDVTVAGLSFQGPVGPVTLKGEAAYLTGSDDVANADSGPAQLLDVNDGDLEGYVLYADAEMPLGPGALGAVFGLGSGDDDPMAGDGNITKIRTNGFFYVTEVWEDSVMPDEEGITPQGLGSPASRGYREFENTTLLQLNYSWKPAPDWRLFLSGTFLQATEDLHPWSDLDGDGAIEPGEFGAESSDDLGSEIDFRLDWNVMKHVTWTLRGGYMWAGDAAGFLINGTDRYDENPWELRTTVRVGFDGIQIATVD